MRPEVGRIGLFCHLLLEAGNGRAETDARAVG